MYQTINVTAQRILCPCCECIIDAEIVISYQTDISGDIENPEIVEVWIGDEKLSGEYYKRVKAMLEDGLKLMVQDALKGELC